ncbi:amidohydrolase family protein (plasmid) [Agrobacterium leguminum]|uniref:amidohydrolase family protein n=1 Tax=Agrobacterium leguminum TaxID=2792015 RepID=UPI00272D38DF|nr:amidohydrolase family protein [Agrobacterium leguminum]WLE00912.1 amidohydrolase family protein [Agrobacterium leguminum]
MQITGTNPHHLDGISPSELHNARLPRWLLRHDWPNLQGAPALARVVLRAGVVDSIEPMPPENTPMPADAWDLRGAPVLPAFVDAHVHLDKTFTLQRVGPIPPGLLAAIDAEQRDALLWTADDVAGRAAQGLCWGHAAGTRYMRSHVNWQVHEPPLAWSVLNELAARWADRVTLDLVAFPDARRIAQHVARSGPHARLGGFVHSVSWSREALRNLLMVAQEFGLDVDLHVDEELNPDAVGLLAVAEIVKEINFAGRVVCGHVCALAAKPPAQALATLDAVAELPITLVCLPTTNLLLQDAAVGRTPLMRGITLIKEARARAIPVLFGSDNVQDPFCRVGSYDPVDSFMAAVLAAQLDEPFDDWSQSICRGDWLQKQASNPGNKFAWPADLVIFTGADAQSWPARAHERVLLRQGRLLAGRVPAHWCAPWMGPSKI